MVWQKRRQKQESMKRLSILACIFCVFYSCSSTNNDPYQQIDGSTMGTYYIVKCPEHDQSLKSGIDSVLLEFNQQLSTYIDNSLISQINRGETDRFEISKSHIKKTFEISRLIYTSSDGDFDPTIAILTNYWGFGYTGRKPISQVDSTRVNSLKSRVGFDKITFNCDDTFCSLDKSVEGIKFDFNAIAKGQGVDAIADYLRQQGIEDFLVDIGGEQVLSGKNAKGEPWSIGLNNPIENADYRDIIKVLQASNIAVASSGNYRSFYELNGEKYSHTLNPHTGFPERSNLLGTTVVANSCIFADAYATTCMVKGLEKSISYIESLPDVEAIFFYNNQDSLDIAMSSGFANYIKE